MSGPDGGIRVGLADDALDATARRVLEQRDGKFECLARVLKVRLA